MSMSSQGWNRSRPKDEVEKRGGQVKVPPSAVRGLIAGLIVLALGMGAWWTFSGGEKSREVRDAKRDTRIKEVKPAAAKPAPKAEQKVEEAKPATTNSPRWEAVKGLDPKLFPYKDGRKVMETRTNDWGQVIDICMMPYGKTRKVIREAKPRPFQTATDQLIALAIAGNNDEAVPPIPLGNNLEAEFFESLQHPIVINDDDSDEVKQAKENVIEARKIIDEELRKGRSFKSVLEDHLAQRKQNAELREQAMDSVRELKKDGDPSMVNEYMKRVNGMLREKGIGEIQEPMTRRERMEAKERQQVSEGENQE